MQFKVKINTELKINMIKGIRMLAEDNNIEGLKGLREAKDAVEQGIIVNDTNLNYMLQALITYYKRVLLNSSITFEERPVTFIVEQVELKPTPYVMPFRRDFVVNV